MIDIVGRVRWIRDKVNNIFDLATAIFTLTETGGTITTAVAPGADIERDVYINETPAGVYQPLKVQIDLTTLAAAEIVVIRTYYRIKTGGGLIKKEEVTFTGVQSEPLKNVELEPNRYGIQVTLQRTAGAQRLHDWCVFYRG